VVSHIEAQNPASPVLDNKKSSKAAAGMSPSRREKVERCNHFTMVL
jgi:hypothetical protein